MLYTDWQELCVEHEEERNKKQDMCSSQLNAEQNKYPLSRLQEA
jgi:hypothetical protein